MSTRRLIPALSPLYDGLGPYADLLTRVVVGLFLMPHGAQKLFGMFGGYGIAGTGQYFGTKLGMEPGWLFALLAGLVEFFGGLLLVLGLLTRPAAAACFVLLMVAVLKVHLPNGFFATAGGYEYPLLWALVVLSFVVRGGGPLSLDAKLGREF
jgi:putative oxidoreductase